MILRRPALLHVQNNNHHRTAATSLCTIMRGDHAFMNSYSSPELSTSFVLSTSSSELQLPTASDTLKAHACDMAAVQGLVSSITSKCNLSHRSYGFMPELTCILHSHIYIDIHITRSADSRGQNVSITPAASVTAAATAASTTMAKAVATATADSAYWHGEGSLEPYVPTWA